MPGRKTPACSACKPPAPHAPGGGHPVRRQGRNPARRVPWRFPDAGHCRLPFAVRMVNHCRRPRLR